MSATAHPPRRQIHHTNTGQDATTGIGAKKLDHRANVCGIPNRSQRHAEAFMRNGWFPSQTSLRNLLSSVLSEFAR
jgi:hypothetical protein